MDSSEHDGTVEDVAADLRAGEDLEGTDALQRVADIARQLAAAESLDQTLQRIVDTATEYIEQCDGATLMIVRSGEVSTPAASHVDAKRADEAQYATGEGPCLSSMREHETIVIDDIAADERWPDWRDEVDGLGWRSMLGLRLFVAEDTLGALDLYSRQRDGFDRESQVLGQVFASHAAVAMKSAINDQGLKEALASRDVIGRAKGILMERERLTGQQAFDRLRKLSNDRNVKLRELAQRISETGEIPD